MKTVKVSKRQLLEKLKENLKEHKEIFEEAQVGYQKKVLEILEERMAAAREGKRISHVIELHEPVNMTEEYEIAIEMLEMSLDEELEITNEEFRCFVLDKWRWMDNFLMSNSGYSVKALGKMGS